MYTVAIQVRNAVRLYVYTASDNARAKKEVWPRETKFTPACLSRTAVGGRDL